MAGWLSAVVGFRGRLPRVEWVINRESVALTFILILVRHA
jgi:hypothetical protein